MRFLPIIMALCLLPMAAHAEEHTPGTCYQKTITVCVPKKPKKKKPAVVVAPAPTPPPPAPQPPVVVTVTQTQTVTREVPVPVPCSKPHVKECRKEPKVIVGGYAALGVGVRDQYVQGNVGLHLEFPKARLGLRVFTALDKGVGADAMVYVYRGEKLKVHVLDLGIVVTGHPFNETNNTDVLRRIDMIFGAGIQYKLLCNLDLIADWRVTLADPVMLAGKNGKLEQTGPNTYRYLDAPHVVGNSFSSSQILLGLLLHI